MSSRTWIVALPLAALGSITAAPRAHACSPLPSGVLSTIPADGEKYPGNAAVILQGQGISLTDASVTVDGKPAMLKDASATAFVSGTGFFGVFVEPVPAAGQSVVITGTFCPSPGCNPVVLHYQATAAFDGRPAPVEIAEVDVLDYPDFKSSGGDCQSDSSSAWWLHLKTPLPDRATEGVVLYTIRSTPGFGGEPDFVARGIVTASWNPVLAVRDGDAEPGGPPLPEWKHFSITTVSSNGNMPPGLDGASPRTCHYRVDTGPSPSSPPGEPMWTAADIYPGGPCDSAATSTSGASSGAGGSGGGGGGGDQVIGGCGCAVAGDAKSPTGLLGALALAIGGSLRLARRRRS